MVRALLLLSLFFQVISGTAQDQKTDTAFVHASVQKAISLYTEATQGQTGLYNGSDYPEYQLLKKGEHPYYIINDWSTGMVKYAGDEYRNIDILYDICRDKVVIENYYNHSMMELTNEKLGGFSIFNRIFIPLAKDDINHIKAGFYNQLYNGKTKVYAKYEKTLQKTIKNKQISYYFAEKTRYYIVKNGIFYPVKTRSSVMQVFKDREKELKQFAGKSKVSFSRKGDRGNTIARMAEFYDDQTNMP